MRHNFLKSRLLKLLPLLVLLAGPAMLPSARAEGSGAVFLSGGAWKIAPQAEIAESGEQVSMPGYRTKTWVAAQVPGTVFGSYVNAGLEKEPTYGDNIYKVVSNRVYGPRPRSGGEALA